MGDQEHQKRKPDRDGRDQEKYALVADLSHPTSSLPKSVPEVAMHLRTTDPSQRSRGQLASLFYS